MERVNDMIRIIIADDQVLFAESLKIMLEASADDIRVVGIAQNGEQVIRLTKELRPDLILMDIRMPETDGISATRAIREWNPDQKILIITSFQEKEYAFKLMKLGAAGYLLKNMPPQQLITAIRAVNDGMTLLSGSTASQLFRTGEDKDEEEELLVWYKNVYVSMSNREREVFKLLVAGYTNRQIANDLYLSEPTIRNYISSIYTKLNTNNRIEVIEHGKKIFEFFSED